jgi:hypothetical protein
LGPTFGEMSCVGKMLFGENSCGESWEQAHKNGLTKICVCTYVCMYIPLLNTAKHSPTLSFGVLQFRISGLASAFPLAGVLLTRSGNDDSDVKVHMCIFVAIAIMLCMYVCGYIHNIMCRIQWAIGRYSILGSRKYKKVGTWFSDLLKEAPVYASFTAYSYVKGLGVST